MRSFHPIHFAINVKYSIAKKPALNQEKCAERANAFGRLLLTFKTILIFMSVEQNNVSHVKKKKGIVLIPLMSLYCWWTDQWSIIAYRTDDCFNLAKWK